MADEGSNVIRLPNGIELDPDAMWAPGIRDHARRKGFPGLRAFVATHPDGKQAYLLVEGQDAIFESQSYEAACAHIDIMAMAAS